MPNHKKMKEPCKILSMTFLQKLLGQYALIICRPRVNYNLVIVFLILFQSLSPCSSAIKAQVPITKDAKVISNSNRMASSHLAQNVINNDIVDVVGFGEDCSPGEGLICDGVQNLVCDPIEETCVCDELNGYHHVNKINGDWDDWIIEIRGVCARRKSPEEKETEKYLNSVLGEKKIETAKPEQPKNINQNQKFKLSTEPELDVVGYKEDCSPNEGPLCDSAQFLICDPDLEICVCDYTKGYIHVTDVPGMYVDEQRLLLDGTIDLPKSLCINKDHVAERAKQLLLGSAGSPSQEPAPDFDTSDEYAIPEVVMGDGGTDNNEDHSFDPFTVYNDMMTRYTLVEDEAESGQRNDRLAPFRLPRGPLTIKYEAVDVIVNEILKYTHKGSLSLKPWEDKLKELLGMSRPWRDNKLTYFVCTAFFDVDHDKLAIPEEYAVVLLSEKVREVVMPKAFLDIIIPLPEENCITIEDFRKRIKEDSLEADFASMDKNNDRCISFDEYRVAIEEMCAVSWLQIFFEAIGYDGYERELDPSPEEIYIRRLMRNEKLNANWKLIDTNGDGVVDFKELHRDLEFSGLASSEDTSKTEELMEHLDSLKAGAVELVDIKLQIIRPTVTKDYQFEWLESLYELFDSDDDEVLENLEAFEREYEELTGNFGGRSLEKAKDRLFSIFDKNRNNEWDEVEFKLVMELMTKFVVYQTLNDTVTLMDQTNDMKVSLFEYEEFFKSSSRGFQIFMKNLITLEEELMDEMGDKKDDGIRVQKKDDDDEEEEDDLDDEEDPTRKEHNGMVTRSASSEKLSKRAAKANETLVVYKLFLRLDMNHDGFLTKEDFFSHSNSYITKKTEAELKEEFDALDRDKNGVLTQQESDDIIIPVDFAAFKLGLEILTGDVVKTDYEALKNRLDSNNDTVISKKEYDRNYKVLSEVNDIEPLLEWIEAYLKTSPPMHIVDPDGERTFKELDYNCDGFITLEEFREKLEELRKKSQSFQSYYSRKITGETDFYFTNLDLNRDGSISYNEFHFLLLRENKKITEF